ncbi:MAG: hypothetical protein R3E79_62025 [Caldilineaceae bacterium]
MHQVTVQGYMLAERHSTQGDSSAGIATSNGFCTWNPGMKPAIAQDAIPGCDRNKCAGGASSRPLSHAPAFFEELGVTPEAATTALCADARHGAARPRQGDR